MCWNEEIHMINRNNSPGRKHLEDIQRYHMSPTVSLSFRFLNRYVPHLPVGNCLQRNQIINTQSRDRLCANGSRKFPFLGQWFIDSVISGHYRTAHHQSHFLQPAPVARNPSRDYNDRQRLWEISIALFGIVISKELKWVCKPRLAGTFASIWSVF